MCIIERLNLLIGSSNMTIKSFSEQTEIPYRSVQSYLRAERELSIEAAIKIARAFDISLNWLVLGQGEMFVKDIGELSEQEQKLILSYRELSDSVQKISLIQMVALARELSNE